MMDKATIEAADKKRFLSRYIGVIKPQVEALVHGPEILGTVGSEVVPVLYHSGDAAQVVEMLAL